MVLRRAPRLIFQLSIIIYALSIFTSCSLSKQIGRSAKKVITDSSLLAAHVGISIYEPAAGKYWYNYQGDKYFVPASNTKIPTCYAAMKYLGDSLVSARVADYRNDLIVLPSADPTFLNKEFNYQSLLSTLAQRGSRIIIDFNKWHEFNWGNGWSWNDYEQAYMAERSIMPMYGNVVTVFDFNDSAKSVLGSTNIPRYRTDPSLFSNREFWYRHRYKLNLFLKDVSLDTIIHKNKIDEAANFKIGREIGTNLFYGKLTYDNSKTQVIPFSTTPGIMMRLLEDTLKKKIVNANRYFTGHENLNQSSFHKIHSQPTDSLLKPMMHRSDNFFAEQTLLMVSNEMLGVMNDERIIDTLLKTDFKDLPQKPRWADGSGLSRYNLFTPQSFVSILDKMRNEFGMERIKVIFPTGGEGTLSSYYKSDSGFIYAKTGTLSGVVALSGYLYTKKNRLLLFSVLVNNHRASATAVRRSVEQFISSLRDKY